MLRDPAAPGTLEAMTEFLALAPGVGVYRRDAGHLQLGLSPGVVLRDRPGLWEALRTLRQPRPRPDTVRAIAEAAPTVDAEALVRALLLQRVVAVVDQPAGAPGGTVAVMSDGSGDPVARRLRRSLQAAGILRAPSLSDADWVLLVSDGEPPRGLLSDWHDRALRSVTLTLLERQARWGPAVDPRRTPCWSCLDAALGDWDPAWPALTTQFGEAHALPASRSLGAALTDVLAGHVTRDLLDLLAGRRPAVVGGTVTIGEDLEPVGRSFGAHPACGCLLLGPADLPDDP